MFTDADLLWDAARMSIITIASRASASATSTSTATVIIALNSTSFDLVRMTVLAKAVVCRFASIVYRASIAITEGCKLCEHFDLVSAQTATFSNGGNMITFITASKASTARPTSAPSRPCTPTRRWARCSIGAALTFTFARGWLVGYLGWGRWLPIRVLVVVVAWYRSIQGSGKQQGSFATEELI